MRCCTKSDFAETYCFGHNSCNSGLFLLKIGLKCANFLRGITCATGCNRFKLVWLRCLKNMQPQLLVWFGFRSFFGCMDRTCRHYRLWQHLLGRGPSRWSPKKRRLNLIDSVPYPWHCWWAAKLATSVGHQFCTFQFKSTRLSTYWSTEGIYA